jgi:hypothetical protein
VYRTEGVAAPVFRQVSEPGAKDLQGLVEQIALRIGRTLEQRVLIERDIENAWLAALVPLPRMHLTRYQGVYGIGSIPALAAAGRSGSSSASRSRRGKPACCGLD